MAEGGADSLNSISITTTSDEDLEVSNNLTSLSVFHQPLSLIKNETGGRFSIDDGVLNQISQIDSVVNVIAITGPYRQGKSYLMNRLARNKHGFSVGNAVEAKTKGVWVWCLMHPVYKDQVMILLDTEGIGDVEKIDSDNDYKLLCLATLICSTFIYNVKGVIDRDTFDKLGFVTFYAKRVVGSRRKQENAYTTDLGLYFPKFVLCLRDFSHDLGKKTANEYLENRLELQENRSAEIDKYNQIRVCIRNFFMRRECFIFDTPVGGRQNLSRLEHIDETELLSSFKEDSDKFIDGITKYQPKKLLDGKMLTGRMFSSLVRIYVDTLNAGEKLCIDNALTSMARQENSNVLEEVAKSFLEHIRKIELPVFNKQEFLKLYEKEKEVAMEEFRSKCILNIDEKLRSDFVKELDKIWKELFDENIKTQRRMCISEMEKIYDSEIKKKLLDGGYQDADGYLTYMKDIDSMKAKIKKTFPKIDVKLLKKFRTEFTNDHIEDDAVIMKKTGKSKRAITEEHDKKMQEAQDEFRKKFKDMQDQYQKLNDEREREFTCAEENYKKEMDDAKKEWESENNKILKSLEKSEESVKILMSLVEGETKANEPSTFKTIGRAASSLLPVIGPIIYDAVERGTFRKRKNVRDAKMKEIQDVNLEKD